MSIKLNMNSSNNGLIFTEMGNMLAMIKFTGKKIKNTSQNGWKVVHPLQWLHVPDFTQQLSSSSHIWSSTGFSWSLLAVGMELYSFVHNALVSGADLGWSRWPRGRGLEEKVHSYTTQQREGRGEICTHHQVVFCVNEFWEADHISPK